MGYKKEEKIISSIKNTNIKAFLLTGTILLAVALFVPMIVRAASLDYVPLEEIPGISTKSGDLKTYLVGIYKFGIWTVGIAALLMITIGGFMYITSAGNNAAMGKAKGVITDAIIGLIMALTAWMLLNTINPDLLNATFNLTSSNTNTTAAQAAQNKTECSKYCTELGGSETVVDKCTSNCIATKTEEQSASGIANAAKTAQNQADCDKYCTDLGGSETVVSKCTSNCMTTKAAESASLGTGSTAVVTTGTAVSGSNCSQINDAVNKNNQNVDPTLLKTIMAGGENCDKKVSTDGKGSCGYSQALPATRKACGITGTDAETCAKIQADVQLDANCAAQTVVNMNKYSKGKCTTTNVVSAGCCYNGGQSSYDCSKNSWYGTKIKNYTSKYGTNV